MSAQNLNETEELYNVTHAFEFDSCDAKHRIEIRESEKYGDASIVLCYESGNSEILLDSQRDQWGTWIGNKHNTAVAQEDGTRSFIDAYIKALEKFKRYTDCETLPATEIEIK